ncbi:Rho GTPase activation protein [Backusella circina FSU 941]|nr:Rho GTPase activation protein [Backusella circina FSU 941]
MKRSHSNPPTLSKRRSIRGWLKRVTIPNSNQRKVAPDNGQKDGVFGVPLDISLKYAKTSIGYVDEDNIKHSKACTIPILVGKCGSYLKRNALETEGIFRITGSIKRVNALEFLFDQSSNNYGLDLNWEGYTVHDAASLLRRYLTRLPEPVIPHDRYHAFRDVMTNNAYSSNEQRIETFQKLIHALSAPHQHLLLYILDTLSLFAAYSAENKMGIANLAAVFSPGVLRHPDHNSPYQYKISQRVIEFLIEFQSLFTMELMVSVKKNSQKSAMVNKSVSPSSSSSSPSSTSSEIPPVPLLLPSSYNKKAPSPPLPEHYTQKVQLHVANPNNNQSVGSLAVNPLNSEMTTSPLEISSEVNSRSITTDQTPSPIGTDTKKQLQEKATKITLFVLQFLYHRLIDLKHFLKPWIAKPTAILLCFSVVIATILTIVYEFYLAYRLDNLEPVIFFLGFVSYWFMLFYGSGSLSSNASQSSITSEQNALALSDDEEYENISQPEEIEAFTQATAEEDKEMEEAMLQDETIMSEWRDLLTRAWKVTGEHDDDATTITSHSGIISHSDDACSTMSKASRFNEEDDIFSSSGSSDDEEEFGFDPESIDHYLKEDQIKTDAMLAQKIQSDERKNIDRNNPFLNDKQGQPSQPSSPTSDQEKEVWKLRVYSR